jgi:acyl-CoA reductase-like NAD-dependent aldehyde dehydrogenase
MKAIAELHQVGRSLFGVVGGIMLKPLSERKVPTFSSAINYLRGEAQEGKGKPHDVIFPATGETLVELKPADSDQLEAVLSSARASFEKGEWRRTQPSERARLLNEMAEHILARKEDLATRIAFDNGKTYSEAVGEVFGTAAAFRSGALCCATDEGYVPPPERGVVKFVWREPVGVVLGITPFNAPLGFSAVKAAPALAAGNSVILKTSKRAPLLPIAVCEAAEAVGLPKGILSLVHAPRELASALCEDPRVNVITLTGGTYAGTQMIQAAAPTIKNLVLELGGKSAHIVLADADLDAAVPGVAAGIYRNSGQRCFSGSRLVVEESVADKVEQAIIDLADSLVVGDPFDPTTQVGAMIDMRAVEDAEAFIARSLEDGLEIGAGGKRVKELEPGSFFRPTVLLNAKADSYAAQEEIFAPVLTVIRVKDVDEAIEVANNSSYGLAGGVWSNDLDKAMKVAREVRTGYMWVNTYAAIFGDVPFGGYGLSGTGREAGRWGYEAYTELKSVLMDTVPGGSTPYFEGTR